MNRRLTRGAKLLGDWLRAHKDEGKDQTWLAGQIGSTQQNVSAWTRGAMPGLRYALRIGRVTGIGVELWDELAPVSRRGSVPPPSGRAP